MPLTEEQMLRLTCAAIAALACIQNAGGNNRVSNIRLDAERIRLWVLGEEDAAKS